MSNLCHVTNAVLASKYYLEQPILSLQSRDMVISSREGEEPIVLLFIDHLTSDIIDGQFVSSNNCSLPVSVRAHPTLISTQTFKIPATH